MYKVRKKFLTEKQKILNLSSERKIKSSHDFLFLKSKCDRFWKYYREINKINVKRRQDNFIVKMFMWDARRIFFFFKDCYKQKTKVGEGGSGILIRKMPWKVIDLRLVDWSQYTKGGMMNVLAWASR